MESELMITVQEALLRPLFGDALVIAGNNGLNRRIRWVHILEISHFETLIHGEEMILTTGVGFSPDAVSPLTFLEKLIAQKATCLCIEIGQYIDSVPEEMIELANRHDFPLILFPHTVRFIDITQDLHSLIINRHHKVLQDLESISREFYRLTLTSQGISNVLKLLHKSTGAQIIYWPIHQKPVSVPVRLTEEQKELIEYIDECLNDLPEMKPNASPYQREYRQNTVLLQPVGALGQTWAFLVMVCTQKPQEYDYLLLDSASLSIAQELLRNRYVEERKLYKENLWVHDLLHTRLEDEEQIKSLIGPDYKSLNVSKFRVCLFEIENLYELNMEEDAWKSLRFHISLILRSTFEKLSFLPLITLKNNLLIVIAVDMSSKVAAKATLREALESLRQIKVDEKTASLRLRIGVGKSYVKLKNAHHSYQEALEALSLYAYYNKPFLLYEELGVFQLLLNLNDEKMLQSFIRNYLDPLIEQDQAKGSEMVHTLKVYLDNDCSKQIAAQKLYIVRQSLYYRLEKITELLAEDFLSPENRVAIQVALRAYQLLYPGKFAEKSKEAPG